MNKTQDTVYAMNTTFKSAVMSAISTNKVTQKYNAADISYVVTNKDGMELMALRDNHAYDLFTITVNKQEVFKSHKNGETREIIELCRNRMAQKAQAHVVTARITEAQSLAAAFLQEHTR